MRVILSERTYTCQSVQLARLLVTINRTELSAAERQLLVRARLVLEDHTVVRAVHRLEHIYLAFLGSRDRLERVLAVMIPVTRGDVQLLRSDMRSDNLLIAVTLLDTLQEIFQSQTQCRSLRQPYRQTFADHVAEHEQFHLLAYLTVVTFLGFLQQSQILVKHRFLRERYTVYSCHHWPRSIAAPVGGSTTQHLDCLDRLGAHQVRTFAQVGKVALRIGGYMSVFQLADQFALVTLTFVAKRLECVCLADLFLYELLFLGTQLHHFCFDSRKVAILDYLTFRRQHVIVEAVLNSRSYTELYARIKLLQSLSHQVAGGVPEGVFGLGIFPLMQPNLCISQDWLIKFHNLPLGVDAGTCGLDAGA